MRFAHICFALTDRAKPETSTAGIYGWGKSRDRHPNRLVLNCDTAVSAQSQLAKRASLVFAVAILQLTAYCAHAATTTIPPITEYRPAGTLMPNLYYLILDAAANADLPNHCYGSQLNCALTNVYIYPNSFTTAIAEYTYQMYDTSPPYTALLGPYNGLFGIVLSYSCPVDYELYIVGTPIGGIPLPNHSGGGNGPLECRRTTITTDLTQKSSDFCSYNPIFPGTGNKSQVDTDYVGTGAFPLVFKRTYNSLASLRAGWRDSYERSITFSNDAGVSTALVTRGDGRAWRYTLNTVNGMWIADADVTTNLSSVVFHS